MSVTPVRIKLNSQVTCPTCWHQFPAEKILWVTTHPDLIGDPQLGEHASSRFLPTRFDTQGNAIDTKNSICNELACPRCHLNIPWASLEIKPTFISIAGTPSCGKSYFLTSMTWQLRQNLSAEFRVGFSDADPSCNRILNAYEEQQFFSADLDTPVRLRKTEEQGDDYISSLIDGQSIQFVSPFLFTLRPIDGHPNAEKASLARLLCLYDNAGESFAPGRDGVSNPVTRHLGHAMAIFFCYDLMQDPRIRKSLSGKTNDVQVVEQSVTARQEIVLHEVIERHRRLTGLSRTGKTDRPLVIVATKADGWLSLLDNLVLERPVVRRADGLCAIDLRYIREVSNRVRSLLSKHSSELVSAAEAFSKDVWYIPVSATGRAPEKDEKTGIVGVRPKDMNPTWCDIPLATAMALHGSGLIPFIDHN